MNHIDLKLIFFDKIIYAKYETHPALMTTYPNKNFSIELKIELEVNLRNS